jgi:halocyanin-like protein
VAAAGVAASTVDAAAAQTADGPDYGGWFDGVDNYDGTVDRTGQETVTITVGAAGNGGNYAFGPAAVRVDPGTEVVWKWSGKGSVHNVVAADGSFESELTDEAGHTFTQVFEATGVVKYACAPHQAMGMKGAVVVGTPSAGTTTKTPTTAGGDESSGPDYGGWFEGVDNYDGTADRTGQETVTITVGAAGNNGNYAFDPPAVRIDPGTTVIWEWAGTSGGMHDVVAADGSFESELTDEAGHRFEQTFDSPGVVKYVCTPHEQLGMKGALVVVGSGRSDGDLGETLALGGGVGLAGALLAMFGLGARGEMDGPE